MTEVLMPGQARLDAAGVLHHVVKETCRAKKRLLFLRGNGTGNHAEGSRRTFLNLRTGCRPCRREGETDCAEEGIEAYQISFLAPKRRKSAVLLYRCHAVRGRKAATAGLMAMLRKTPFNCIQGNGSNCS